MDDSKEIREELREILPDDEHGAERQSAVPPGCGEESPFAASDTEAAEPVRRPSRLERYVGQVLSGSILTRAEVRRQYPYVFFMAVLMFLYIANGFRIQRLHRDHDRLNGQIKELRARSLTISSQRMMSTRQSEIMSELEKRGIPLEESLSPPKVIDK